MSNPSLFQSLTLLFPDEPLKVVEILRATHDDQKLAGQIREMIRYGAGAVKGTYELWKLEAETQACLRALAKAKNDGILSSWEVAMASSLMRSSDKLRGRVLNAEILGSFDIVKEMIGTLGPLERASLFLTFRSSSRSFLVARVSFLHRYGLQP